MKKSLFLFLWIAACGTTKPIKVMPPPVTPPEPAVTDTIRKTVYDTTRVVIGIPDTVRIPDNGEISVKAFGAKCDGVTDDYLPDSTACSYCMTHPSACSTVTFPVGHSRISRPLILSNKGSQFTIHIKGMYPAKEASDNYLSQIICDFKAGPGVGIINGRGIVIENLSIIGKYTFPYSVTNALIGTLKFSDWVDPTIIDSRYNPYAVISIDPYPGYAGSSGVEIRQCAIKQFMVGIALSSNSSTVNDEMINIIDDDIEAVRVAIAIGQDQSKEIHIDRLKCWASTHTILDGLTYGRGTGGGSVMIEGMNIAGNVNELFHLNTDRFPLSAKDVYSESLFRIGSVGNGAGANFINFQIDFLTGPGLPAADYILSGQANFYGGMLRYYDGTSPHRLNLSYITGRFSDLTLNNPPFIVGLYGGSVYPTPTFDNIHLYNHGTTLAPVFDTLIPFQRTAPTIDRASWLATIVLPHGTHAHISDYILGSPESKGRRPYDTDINPGNIATLQIGCIYKLSGDTAFLNDVGVNVWQTTGYDAMYLSRVK